MNIAKLHDNRAELIIQQLEIINSQITKISDPILNHHMVHGGLAPVESILRASMFIARTEKLVREKDFLLASQVAQNISGIEWYTVQYGGLSVELPRLNEELALAPGDKEILMRSKSTALLFLAHCHQGLRLWCYDSRFPELWSQKEWSDFYQEYLQQEWIEIWVDNSVLKLISQHGTYQYQPIFSINACCCWGNFLEVNSINTSFKSGSFWFQWNNSQPGYSLNKKI